jgi:hypothetical protein
MRSRAINRQLPVDLQMEFVSQEVRGSVRDFSEVFERTFLLFSAIRSA